jgi:hypothetical protein
MKKIELQIEDEAIEQIKIIFSLKHMMGGKGLNNAARSVFDSRVWLVGNTDNPDMDASDFGFSEAMGMWT